MSTDAKNPGENQKGASDGGPRVESFDLLLGDVPVELSVELGRVIMTMKEVGSRLGPGSIIALSKLTGDKLDVRVNDRLVARAEAVAIGDRYGARIVEIVRNDKDGIS